MSAGRTLGRSLEALGISELLSDLSAQQTQGLEQESMEHVAIELLKPGASQPRRVFNTQALQELASSIQAQGVVQPIVVRRLQGGSSFEIVAGERRWRAAQLAGLSQVPVVIKHLDDRTALAVALIENLQREDLNPIEQADAIGNMIEQFEMTHQTAAEVLGKSRSHVSNLVRLLQLDRDVKALLSKGDIEMGHARCLISLKPEDQLLIANQIIAGGLSVRQSEVLVARLSRAPKESAAQPLATTLEKSISGWESKLSKSLPGKLKIAHQSSGKGQIKISYENWENLERILAVLEQD